MNVKKGVGSEGGGGGGSAAGGGAGSGGVKIGNVRSGSATTGGGGGDGGLRSSSLPVKEIPPSQKVSNSLCNGSIPYSAPPKIRSVPKSEIGIETPSSPRRPPRTRNVSARAPAVPLKLNPRSGYEKLGTG